MRKHLMLYYVFRGIDCADMSLAGHSFEISDGYPFQRQYLQ
jgi:hypothetical protein